MTSLELLVELNSLSFAARQTRIVELGRDPQNASLWDELERGSSYERRIAALSCATSRDGERALRLANDASRLVRGLALEMVALVGDDEQIARVWPLLSRRLTRLFIKKLVGKRNRQSAVDAFLEARFAQGSLDEGLVAFASTEVAARLLEGTFARASAPDFARLARLQPRVALGKALEIARALLSPDGVALEKCNAVLGEASAFTTPETQALAVELVRELNRTFPLQKVNLSALVGFGLAQRIAELELSSGERVALDFSSRAHKLELETLLALVESGNIGSNWIAVLKRVPPSKRAAIYERFNIGWRGNAGAISPAIVALLPREIRRAEARRHLQIPSLRAQPRQSLPYAAFLTADEALETLKPFLGDPDPDFRAAALSSLVGNVRFERANVGAVLEILVSRANEQDPVRGAMLGALAQLPPLLWREEHLPILAKLQRQALDARDLSFGTAAHLERLAVALLPLFPEWASAQIAELLKERGHVSFFDLQSRVNNTQMRAIGPRLEPIFRAWAERERAPFLNAMRSLGKRLKVWDAGAQLLVTFTRNGPVNQRTVSAQILSDFRRDLWRELVPQLLKDDESWGTQAIVYNFLHQKRQDLWRPALLGRSKPNGKFWTGKTRFVLPFQTGFYRWTPDQQATFALTLGEVISDKARDNPGVFASVNALAQLPDIAPTTLLELSQLSFPTPATREAALRVLSRLDAGQGVATLLESLDDERARIAIYGLRRALLEMPSSRALEILRGVSLRKVTVAKEVLRLLGDLEGSEAFDFLLELSERDLHRDARVALLRALWEHLENPRVWPILEEAARSDDAAIATMAARTTAPRLSVETREKLNALLGVLLAHLESRVRLQVLQNGALGVISDPNAQLLAPMLRCLESDVSQESRSAMIAIWKTYAATQGEAIGAALRNILPRRRTLREMVEILVWDIAYSPRHSEVATRAALEALASDPLTLHLRLKLALPALKSDEFGALVESLVATDALHAENFVALCRTLEEFDLTHATRYRKGTEALQTRWATSPSPMLRRLSLSLLIAAAKTPQGWTDARREALETFRRDESALVAGKAQFTFWDDGNDEEAWDEEEDDLDFDE